MMKIAQVSLIYCLDTVCRWSYAGHAVHLFAANRFGVTQSGLNALSELIYPFGNASEPAISGRPVARGKIHQNRFQIEGVEALADLQGVLAIGKRKFDGVEASRFCGFKSIKEFELGKKKRQIGGEFQHTIISHISERQT